MNIKSTLNQTKLINKPRMAIKGVNMDAWADNCIIDPDNLNKVEELLVKHKWMSKNHFQIQAEMNEYN